MHALFWDGRISRDADAPVVIQIFARLFNWGMNVQRNIQRNIFGRTYEDEQPARSGDPADGQVRRKESKTIFTG